MIKARNSSDGKQNKKKTFPLKDIKDSKLNTKTNRLVKTGENNNDNNNKNKHIKNKEKPVIPTSGKPVKTGQDRRVSSSKYGNLADVKLETKDNRSADKDEVQNKVNVLEMSMDQHLSNEWTSDNEEPSYRDQGEDDDIKDEIADVIDLVRSYDLETLREGFENFGPEKSARLCVDNDRRGLSPLTLAAEMNRIDIVKLMVEQHSNLDIPNEVGGWTALHCASSQGHVDMVRLLIASGAGLEVGDREGWTALHFSSDLGCLEAVNILVAAGAGINYPTTAEQYTPLYLAAQSGHVDLVSWFLDKGVKTNQPDKDGWTSLHVACSKNHISVVELLLKVENETKKFVNSRTSDGITPIYLAAQHGFSQLTRLLINSGAEVNCLEDEGCAPLHVACQGGHCEVVEVILESPESDVNLVSETETAWYPIHFAVQDNHIKVIEILINNGAKIDAISSHGHTALHLAAGCGHLECLKILMSTGYADSTAIDTLGWCPLHHAVQNGHINIVREFIETLRSIKSKDDETDSNRIKRFVDLKTKEGDTSLLIAVLNDQIAIADLLLEYGATINEENHDEEKEIKSEDYLSVLHAACEVGNPEMISLLVRHEAKIDVKDGKGWTPLHCLSEIGNVECIDSLLSCIATPECSKPKDISGQLTRQSSAVSEIQAGNDKSVFDEDLTPSPVFPSPYMANTLRLNHQPISRSSSQYRENEFLMRILNLQTSDGHTPLFLAAHSGQLKTVRQLLTLGARTDIVDYLGWSPLHAASAKGYTEVVQILLTSPGLDVNRRTYHGFTSLYLSIQEKHTKTAEYLLIEALSDPNLSENQGSCPLHVAAQNGLVDIIDTLMQSGALSNKTDSSGWTALHFAVQDGNPKTVRKLVEHGSDVDARTNDGVTSLFIAVHKNLDEIIEILLQHGARTDLSETDTGLTPLHLACDNGYLRAIQRLLVAGANTEVETKYDRLRPLYMVIRSKKNSDDTAVETLARALLSEGADPMPHTTSGLSTLHIAAQKGMTGIVQALVEHGAEVDALDEAGWTPLMFASRCGKTKTVKALLAAGAKPDNPQDDYRNSEKVDALLLAVQNGHIEVAEVLILWSCNVNSRTCEGTTALYCASQHGDLEMLQMLLFNGADPNLSDENGFIPLHPACLNGHKKVAESLVKAGSSVDHQARDGSRPIQLADRNGHEEIVEWLLVEGAKHPEYENKLTWGANLVSGWGSYIKSVLVKAYRHGMEEYSHVSVNDEDNEIGSGRRCDTLQREAAMEKINLENGKSRGRHKSKTIEKVQQVQKI